MDGAAVPATDGVLLPPGVGGVPGRGRAEGDAGSAPSLDPISPPAGSGAPRRRCVQRHVVSHCHVVGH